MRYTFKEHLRTRLINTLNTFCFNLRNEDEHTHSLRHKIAVDTNCTKEQQRQILQNSGILDTLQKNEILQVDEILKKVLELLERETDKLLTSEEKDIIRQANEIRKKITT